MPYFSEQAELGRDHIYKIFHNTDSTNDKHNTWLRASTGISSQPDVWGNFSRPTHGVIPDRQRVALLQTIIEALDDGSIEYQGALRHVPLDADFSAETMWEQARGPHNQYQNGAFWHMPTGWLIEVLRDSHPDYAFKIFNNYIDHMKTEEQQGHQAQTSWECIGPKRKAYRKANFGPQLR